MSVLSLEHVSKRFRDGRRQLAVLDDVSLEVQKHEWLGIWGARHSGKTTLLQIAAARLRPDTGTVRFEAEDLNAMSTDARARLQRRGGIGLVSGDWRPIRNQPVIEHVALPLLSDGMSLREAREPASRALERVGVGGCAFMPADRLSAHERVRVRLAQTMVRQPRAILLDEPAVLLRPSEAVALYELLHALGRESALAIIIASEELAPLRGAHRIISIGGGKLRETQEPSTVVQFAHAPRRRP
jgi:putative ABC transport system ATP-binding protein